MERLIYEGRFLVNTVGGIIRQDDLQGKLGKNVSGGGLP